MKNKCYIISAAQVSCQKPLSDDWLKSPRIFEGKYVPAVEPDSKGLISPSEARRMGKMLKRAVCVDSIRRIRGALPGRCNYGYRHGVYGELREVSH